LPSQKTAFSLITQDYTATAVQGGGGETTHSGRKRFPSAGEKIRGQDAFVRTEIRERASAKHTERRENPFYKKRRQDRVWLKGSE